MNVKYFIVELISTFVREFDKNIVRDQFNSKFSKKTKDINSYLRALQCLLDQSIDIKHLIGDGEKVFMKILYRDKFYAINGIDIVAALGQYRTQFPVFVFLSFCFRFCKICKINLQTK